MANQLRLPHIFVLLLIVAISLSFQAASPISLADSNGQELDLDALTVKLSGYGPIALVELDMTFTNPKARTMEGKFKYLLPDGATVSRFAKQMSVGPLMEGEVIERKRAHRIYNQLLQTSRDPALLENSGGNKFAAKVHPIGPRETFHVILTFSATISMKDGVRKIIVPLAGLPKIGQLNIKIALEAIANEKLLSVSTPGNAKVQNPTKSSPLYHVNDAQSNIIPTSDVEIKWGLSTNTLQKYGIMAGDFQLLSFKPKMPIATSSTTTTTYKKAIVYIDTSASNQAGLTFRIQAISDLLKQTPTTLTVEQIFRFDIVLREIKLSRNEDISNVLTKEGAFGVTSLKLVFDNIVEHAKENNNSDEFLYVIISDGIITYGPEEVLEGHPELKHVSFLTTGSQKDIKKINSICTATSGRHIEMPLYSEPADKAERQNQLQLQSDVWAKLLQLPGSTFKLADEDSKWLYPSEFYDVKAGDEIIWFEQLQKNKKGDAQIRKFGQKESISFAEVQKTLTNSANFGPLLMREANGAQLTFLFNKQNEPSITKEQKIEIRTQRIDISIKSRILIKETSFLVLESAAMYKQFDIKQRALTDILEPTADGIDVVDRQPIGGSLAPSPVPSPSEIEVPKSTVINPTQNSHEEPEPEVRPQSNEQRPGPAPRMSVENEMLFSTSARVGEAMILSRTGDPTSSASASKISSFSLLLLLTSICMLFSSHRVSFTPAVILIVSFLLLSVSAKQPAPSPSHTILALHDDSVLAPKKNEWKDSLSKIEQTNCYNSIPALQEEISTNPRDAKSRLALGMCYATTRQWQPLLSSSKEWIAWDPENTQAFEFVAKAIWNLKGTNYREETMRAISSIAEVATNDELQLGRTGWILLAYEQPAAAIEFFNRSIDVRKDNVNFYRGLALAYWMLGNFQSAVKVLDNAIPLLPVNSVYGDVVRVAKEEIGIIINALLKEDKHARKSNPWIQEVINKQSIDLGRTDALRVTLNWDTDANDVDLHVFDPFKKECFFAHKHNKESGLQLYSDQVSGLGPEVIRAPHVYTGTYAIGVHYYSAGAMGTSQGVVVILDVNLKPIVLPFALLPDGRSVQTLSFITF